MKFYLITLSILCLSIVSCKKDRTCSCTVDTTGSRTTRSQSAGVSFTLNIGLPLPIPPVQITRATDTTIVAPFSYSDSHKTNYDKVSKRTVKNICPASFEETFKEDYTTIVASSSTVTVNESGTKKYACKIE